MGYVYADQDFIAPRSCAVPPPSFPPFTRPVDEGTITQQGFGQQPTDVVPYALTGPSSGGGLQAAYRFTGGILEQHASLGVAQAWPASNGQLQPAVWDQGTFGQRATGSTPHGAAVQATFPAQLAVQVNGSANPPGVSTGATITVAGTLSLSQAGGLAPLNPASAGGGSVAISVTRPNGAVVSLGTATLAPVPGNPEQFTFSLSAPNAGAQPFNTSGGYTFNASFPGDQLNSPAAGNPVALVVTVS